AARLPLHAAAVRGHPAALRRGHERLAVPGVRGRAGHHVLCLRLPPVAQLQRRPRPPHLPFLDPLPVAAVRGAAGRSLHPLTESPTAMRAVRRLVPSLMAAALATVLLAGCQRDAAPPHKFNAVDLTGAQYARSFDLPDFDGRQRTLADFA